MAEFSSVYKGSSSYLNLAANGNGGEKSLFTIKALEQLKNPDPHILEIGPGGGSTIKSLGRYIENSPKQFNDIRVSIVEIPGVNSSSLDEARNQFDNIGKTALISANALDIPNYIEPGSVDIVNASAVMHEVYSYNGGYPAIHELIRIISNSLSEGGYFAYRDIYTVDSDTLHEKTRQSYTSQSWLRFISMFVPSYLSRGIHPYHRNEDELSFRQDSRLKDIRGLKSNSDALAIGPMGLFREIQRHYITLRDHLWRSGALGFSPVLEGHQSNDWLDVKKGHKRIHFKFTHSNLLTSSQKKLLKALSEPSEDMLAIDGDIFDEVTESAINDFLAETQKGDKSCTEVWDNWISREGHETYAYLTLDQLIGTVALKSIDIGKDKLLLPATPSDITLAPRHYYNRFLRSRLSNPLLDGKQLVLFKQTSIKDTDSIQGALEAVQEHCSRNTLASLYSLVNEDI